MLAIFQQPPMSSYRDIYFSTFTPKVWVMLTGIILCTTMSLRLAFRIYSKFLADDMDPNVLQLSKEITLWAFGALSQQGWYFTPNATAARGIVLVGWIGRIFTFAAFSASLVAILSFEVLPVRSFNDLLKEGFVILSDAHIPSTRFFIKGLEERSQIPALPPALRNVEIDSIIWRLEESRSAVVTLSDSFYPIIRKRGYSDEFTCNALSVVTVGARPIKMSMFVKKASPLREILNHKILVMIERGVQNRLMRNYVVQTSVQCLEKRPSYDRFKSSQTCKDVFTAYVVLFIGFGLGAGLGILEKIYQRIVNFNGDDDCDL